MVKAECDVCGVVCKEGNYAKLIAEWGYGSDYDDQNHETIICQECYDKLPIPKVVLRDSWDGKCPYVIPRQGAKMLFGDLEVGDKFMAEGCNSKEANMAWFEKTERAAKWASGVFTGMECYFSDTDEVIYQWDGKRQ